MILSEEDVGERFVVAQDDVVVRLELLDQVRFEQQRFDFGVGGDDLHRRGLGDHGVDALAMACGPGVACDPFLEILRLADVEDLTVLIQHAINTRRRRHRLELIADHLEAVRERWPIGGGKLFANGRWASLRPAPGTRSLRLRYGRPVAVRKLVPVRSLRHRWVTLPGGPPRHRQSVITGLSTYPRNLWISLWGSQRISCSHTAFLSLYRVCPKNRHDH